MSGSVAINRSTKRVELVMTSDEARELGEFLANEGNDPLGVLLYQRAAELAGWDLALLRRQS
mgnify:CR=1 FL=1